MRILVARCTVDYQGRLAAHLAEAVRLIMVKADGSIAVHADGGAYKPLNWMNPPNAVTESPERWTVTNTRGEKLVIELLEVLSDVTHDLGSDPGLRKDGVEAHLQELLAADPSALEDGYRLVRREYPTAVGPVDMLCRDSDGAAVAVEIKRRGETAGVEQLSRYIEFLNADPALGPVQGLFVAEEIKPQARVLADARGIRCKVVDYAALRGEAPEDLRLF
ncbi:MAG: endonuclease NucS [bacterium]|nr:endonuclease NucS [bacterium]